MASVQMQQGANNDVRPLLFQTFKPLFYYIFKS